MPKRPRLTNGIDYVILDGQIEFTREYLLSIGECCRNDCRFCPFKEPSPPRRLQLTLHPTMQPFLPIQERSAGTVG